MHAQLANYTTYYCSHCQEYFPVPMAVSGIRKGDLDCSNRCKLKKRNGKILKFSKENNAIPSKIPNHLPRSLIFCFPQLKKKIINYYFFLQMVHFFYSFKN